MQSYDLIFDRCFHYLLNIVLHMSHNYAGAAENAYKANIKWLAILTGD